MEELLVFIWKIKRWDKTTQTTNTASTIVSQGKVDIEATEGKAVLKSVDIYGETGIDIKGHEG